MGVFFLSLVLLLFLPFSALALEITGLRVEMKEGSEHVLLRLDGPVQARVFSVQALPPRIAVDIPSARWRGAVEMPHDYRGQLIKKVRFGFHDAKTSRIVFELNASLTPRNVQVIGSREEGAYWLEFDLGTPRAQEKESSAATSSPPASAPLSRHGEKPVIVIDAGHGGQDPGTSGFAGSHEKDLTLRYALALQDALVKTGRYRVALTRNDDRYLLLPERVRRAREDKGDLFISLHADSAPARAARGLSVYTISEKASDKQAEALAAKENKADLIGGVDFSGTSRDVADILIDLTQRETRAKSAQFADMAIRSLGQQVHLLSHTHRFAGFAVLKAPDIPSVLVEVGFLTNPHEESQLRNPAYESRVVHGLVKAIDAYFGRKYYKSYSDSN